MILLNIKREFLDIDNYIEIVQSITNKLDTGERSENSYSPEILHAVSWYRLYQFIKS